MRVGYGMDRVERAGGRAHVRPRGSSRVGSRLFRASGDRMNQATHSDHQLPGFEKPASPQQRRMDDSRPVTHWGTAGIYLRLHGYVIPVLGTS